MNTKIKNGILICLAGSVFITACRKKKETDNDTGLASDGNLVEQNFAEVKNITDAAAYGTLSTSQYKAMADTSILGCATIIHDTTTSPRTLSIDYGNSYCLCGDNKYRKGKILASYTGPYRATGTVITITFDNFFVKYNTTSAPSYQLLGTKTVTNMGLNGSGNIYFNVHIDGTVIKNTGESITWTSDRVREWYAGASTLTWVDDVYKITGTANGSRSDGATFTANINTALEIKLSCLVTGGYVIASGVLTISPTGKSDRVINYGSGNCDNTAIVTINSNSYIITL